VFGPIGGRGGLSTLGYAPGFGIYPDLDQNSNTEHQRPPGGGGGSFYARGEASRDGSGVYLVQSESTWYPFSKCPTNDKVRDATYGNEENAAQGVTPDTPLQCVYMDGALSDPNRVKPGAKPGDAVFADGDPENDYIGVGGELPQLLGGQGGGGGGSRVDSMVHFLWSRDSVGSPEFFGPPYYPKLYGPPFYSPTFFDAKGGAGGGGGGGVQLRCFGDVLIGRTGRVDASGGHGGGAERLKNSTASGGGGGGSGGAIVIQAAGRIRIEADEGHVDSAYVDYDGDEGAALDVSGGFGREAISSPTAQSFLGFGYEFGRSDGGQGGMGLIQLQSNDLPEIDRGAYLFAKKRSVLKLGGWTGDFGLQREHPSFFGLGFSTLDVLRYIDMLHYRYFKIGPSFGPKDYYYVLHGSHPPLVPGDPAGDVYGMVNEYPPGSGQMWADTKMMEYPAASGRFVVEEPEPEKVMETYNGWFLEDDPENGEYKYQEINNRVGDPNYDEFPDTPGTTFAGRRIPFSVRLSEPDATGVYSEQESGTPLRIDSNGNGTLDLADEFDPANLIDRLPVIHPSRTPPPLSSVSRGTSRWLDFQGVALRTRSASGRPPPFFDFVHGTYNGGWAVDSGQAIPAGRDGQVRVAGQVPAAPAHYVADTGFFPFDPGLFGNGSPPDPPYNDVKVDAPELLVQNAITDNATVSVMFQGAHPVRPGASVPDPATLTPWIADLQSLTGYPLVRFQVVFDLGEDEVVYPLGVDSLRPQVDYVRLRARY